MRHAFRRGLVVASCLASASFSACGGKAEPPPRPTVADVPGAADYEKPPAEPDRGPPTVDEASAERPGLRDYRAACRAVAARDLDRATELLERALAAEPEFAEAWYQLGAARSNLAVDLIEIDEARAVRLFRDGVDAKQRARTLMLQGKATLWNVDEWAQARADVDEALRDVDEILVDDVRVAAALRLYRNVTRS